eukprot:CAMPEP_0196824624 /NCGR_PEP_ID=MMETSP1362-20130617/92588_1 /TAXON_ID=163516 /ORGANISM="Leptocylindrus danicus, Strain CCMP1856" /LENGTH=34 /DNA_ID= /DNA_START= /DNA_END= /DNA_ORIENTATION=
MTDTTSTGSDDDDDRVPTLLINSLPRAIAILSER